MEIVYLPKVEKFVKKLDDILAYRVLSSIDLLEKYSSLLRLPVSKPLGQGLFELRIVGNNHIRIFYCFHKNKVYLLHAFEKKSQTISKKEIDIARKLIKEIASL